MVDVVTRRKPVSPSPDFALTITEPTGKETYVASYRRTLGTQNESATILTTWEANGKRAALLESHPDNPDGPSSAQQRAALDHLRTEERWEHGSYRFFVDFGSHIEEAPVKAHPNDPNTPVRASRQAWVSEEEVQDAIRSIEGGGGETPPVAPSKSPETDQNADPSKATTPPNPDDDDLEP